MKESRGLRLCAEKPKARQENDVRRDIHGADQGNEGGYSSLGAFSRGKRRGTGFLPLGVATGDGTGLVRSGIELMLSR